MFGGGAGTATILCTDVVGSTDLRSRLGDVEADLIRRRHDELLGDVVARHGGTVVKGLGDGILAAFGGATDALRAAHEIQGAIERTNRTSPEDHRIEVRVGLSAGDVSWEESDCHGTPVVTAARICDAADGRQILCDDLVRGLARGHTELEFRLQGEMSLKGLPDPVVTFEVPWLATATPEFPLPAPLRHQAGELPFAARAAERQRLTEGWKRAQVDGSTVVLLAGEPGIGKTRLAAEIARQAHDDGALVLLGRCDEHVAAPHAPWTEALRLLIGSVSEEVISEHVAAHGGEISRLIPDLARRVSDAPPPTETDPDSERLLLFDAVVGLMELAARAQPIVVLIDDAHWADAGSVHLLRHVVTHLDPDAHVLVMVTYRDTDIDRGHALAGVLSDLHRAGNTERIALRGLDEDDMRAFLEAAGGRVLDAEGLALAQRLTAETDGNPFFVTEVLRHLVETGAIVQRDGAWVGSQGSGDAGLPQGVRDVVGQRLSRLSEQANTLLRMAAVVGREFDADVVARVAGVNDDTALDALDEAVAARLVGEVEDPPGRLSFAHALVRQTLLEELTTNRRLRIHRQVAEVLDSRPGTSVDVLAHHYLEAAVTGVAPRAVECACEAAANAAARLSWEDAIALYERALEVIDTFDADDPGLRSEIRTELALACHGLGRPDAASGHARQAAEFARAAGDAARLTEAGMAYQGQFSMWARPTDDVGVGIIREGLAGLGTDHPDVRARALAAVAHAHILSPGTAALAEADQALDAAREADDVRALSAAFEVRAWAVRGVLPSAQCRAAAEDAIDAARAANDRLREFAAMYHLGNASLTMGDLERAAAMFAEGSRYAERGALVGWPIADFQAALANARGRFVESDELSDRAHELGGGLGDTNDGIHAGQRWRSASRRGDFDDSARWLEASAGSAVGMVLPYPAVDALERDDDGEARRELRRWVSELLPLLPAVLLYSSLHFVSLLAFRLETLDAIEEMVDYAEGFPGELIGSDAVICGAADAARGRFAAVRGDLDAGVTLLRSGHALHERLALDALIVDTAVDLAAVLLRRDDAGDHAAAAALLEDAQRRADALGMRPAQARVQALSG